jgi:hypothetical protein
MPLLFSHTSKRQALHSRLPIIAARVRSHVEFVVEKYGMGAGFIRVLRLPLPISVPSAAPHSLIILSKTSYSLDNYIVK